MVDIDVLLLAAGFGTRLRPLTDTIPKPLMEVGGKPLIQWNLERLVRENVKRAFINVHYLADQVVRFVKSRDWDLELIVVEEKEKILDTGGAVANILSQIRGDNLLVINSDSLFGKDYLLSSLVNSHLNNSYAPLATMVLRADSRASDYGLIGVDEKGQVLSLRGEVFFDRAINENLMFAGNSILSRRIFEFMSPAGSVFSLTRDTFRKVLAAQGLIWGLKYDGYWNDVGTMEDLGLAQKAFAEGLFN